MKRQCRRPRLGKSTIELAAGHCANLGYSKIYSIWGEDVSELKISRLPFPIVSFEKSAFKETYGGAEDVVVSFCQLIRSEAESGTCLVTMHPIGGTGWLPIMNEFVRHGVHVLACDGRYRGVDSALLMEKAAMDLGAAVRHAKETLGYKHVVLLG